MRLPCLHAEAKLPDGKKLIETEDLIPPGLSALAVQSFLQKVCGVSNADSEKITAEVLLAAWSDERQQFDAINETVGRLVGEDYHVDKMGFAREVVELVHRNHVEKSALIAVEDLKVFEHNFGVLIRRLAEMQRKAERETSQERISRKIDRVIKSFRTDHSSSAKREEAILLLEEVESALDDTTEADHVRLELHKLRRDFDLAEPKPGLVERFAEFSSALGFVRYSARNAVQQESIDLSQARQKADVVSTDDSPAPTGDGVPSPETNGPHSGDGQEIRAETAAKA